LSRTRFLGLALPEPRRRWSERPGRQRPGQRSWISLLELLTPERQLDLGRLPPILSEQARALLAEACRDVAATANGAN
jgi:hypothetical protein